MAKPKRKPLNGKRQTIVVLAKSVMKGHVQGQTVEALVNVIGVDRVLPVIKQIPQGADLSTVDKSVQLVFTDGQTASY